MSLKKCIENECKDCSYAEGSEGGWRDQVQGCEGKSCDLYPVRPLPIGVKHESSASRRKAVNDHCKTCIYDPEDKHAKGTWRAQVANCTKTTCSLYSERPMPSNKNAIEVVNL